MGLSESVDQAEKYLRGLGYDITNQEWVNLRQELYDKKINGYGGLIIKLITKKENNQIIFDRNILNQIEKIIKDNKQILNKLPDNIFNYNSIEQLTNDINRLNQGQDFNRFIKMISTNKEIADELTQAYNDNIIGTDNLNNIIQFVKLPSDERRVLLIKINNIRYLGELYNRLSGIISDIKNGFNFENTVNAIGQLPKTSANILYANNNMIIVRVYDYKASKLLGSKSWCIQQYEETFNDYTRSEHLYDDNVIRRRLFYFFNFNPNVDYELKMIGFVIDNRNNVLSSYDRWDGVFDNPTEYLKGLGILPKIFEFNLREENTNIFKDIKKRLEDDYVNNTKIITNTYLKAYLKMVKDNNYRFNLDSILNMFELITTTEYQGGGKYKNKNINIVLTSLTNNNPLIDEIGFDMNKYNNMLKRVITSNIRISQETKMGIMRYLRNIGFDVLGTVTSDKLKRGKDLTDMEFAMLKNTGKDMSEIIRNKLGALRRGEDVTFNVSEVNYAIDNGFGNIIKKYYTNMLPSFAYEQLSYDDLNVYKKLDMLNQISDVIYKKGTMYGTDTLNSIEKSVYDYAKG